MHRISKGLIASLTLGLGLALTNPSQTAYADYILSKVKSTSCQPSEQPILVQSSCFLMTTVPRPLLRGVVGNYTHRQNYFFFSIYTIEFAGWQDRSLGIGNQFLPLRTSS